METGELTWETVVGSVWPDVSDWSEFQNGDFPLIILYICENSAVYNLHSGEETLQSCMMALILKPGEIRSRRTPGTFCYKRVGVYRCWTG